MSERISVGAPYDQNKSNSKSKSKLIDYSLPGLLLALTLAVGLNTVSVGVFLGAGSAAMAQGEALPLRKVSVDANKLLVFEFATGAAKPAEPLVRELPAPQHRLVFDFAGSAIDSESMPGADQLSAQMNSALPGVLKARCYMVKNAKVPTARLVLDLNPDVKVTPRLVRHEEGAVVLSLGDEVAAVPAVSAQAALPADTSPSTAISDRAPAPSTQSVSDMAAATQAEAQNQTPVAAAAENPANAAAAAKPAAVTDAYEAYYQAFKAQKAEVAKETGDAAEWGPRKGSIGELNGARGIKALVTSSALAAPKIEPDMQANLGGQGREKAKPANAFAEAEANKAKNTIEPEPAAKPESAVEPVQQTAAPAAAALAPAPGTTEKVAQNSASGDWAGASQARNDAGAFKGAPDQRTAGDVDATSGASSKAPLSPSESAAEAPVGAGVKMEEVGASDAAEAKSEDAAAAVDSSEAPQTRARRLFNNAVKAHLSGQLAEAIAGYKSALAVDPELCDAHSNLGLAYNQQHNYANALSELRKALALNPKDAITYNGIGAALKAEKDLPGAIKNWETAVKLDSRLAVAHYNLGTAYEDQGDLDRALVSYENAIRNDGRLGEAYYRIGLIMQKKHRVEEAKEHYKKALKVSDNSDYSADAKQRLATLDRKIK